MSNNYLFPIATQASKDQSEINILKNEIKQLKQQLKEAVEVIEFYHNTRNWEGYRIDHIDHEGISDRWGDLEWIGGKRARQFLAKYTEEK